MLFLTCRKCQTSSRLGRADSANKERWPEKMFATRTLKDHKADEPQAVGLKEARSTQDLPVQSPNFADALGQLSGLWRKGCREVLSGGSALPSGLELRSFYPE